MDWQRLASPVSSHNWNQRHSRIRLCIMTGDQQSSSSKDTLKLKQKVLEYGVTKNHIYLYGLPEFTIIMDHKRLAPIYSTFWRELTPRILKNKLRIQGYNYTLQYEPGGAANLQITSPDTPTTCTKRSTLWNRRQKTSLMPSCRSVYLWPLPSKKYSRQCKMIHACKHYHNPLWTDTALSKTNKIWHHTSTPSKNSLHQMTP